MSIGDEHVLDRIVTLDEALAINEAAKAEIRKYERGDFPRSVKDVVLRQAYETQNLASALIRELSPLVDNGVGKGG